MHSIRFLCFAAISFYQVEISVFSALCIALIQMKVYTNHEAHLAESICKTRYGFLFSLKLYANKYYSATILQIILTMYSIQSLMDFCIAEIKILHF